MSVALHADIRVPERGVDITLEVAAGRTLALVGPNGAGKSTALSVVAGLVGAQEARVQLGDTVLDDAATHVPAHRRQLGLLGQRALLFDHLSVLDNVAYGVRAAGLSRGPARERAAAMLERVGLLDLAERRPRALSGGQAHRVALARTLAVDPQLLLLDEPMAALDVTTAAQMRTLLRAELAGRTCLLVTHDLLDVLALADDIVVLENGRVAEHGPTADLVAAPRSRFLADLCGVNVIWGTPLDDATLQAGPLRVRGTGGQDLGASACAIVSPASVAVFTAPPTGSLRNIWPVEITSFLPGGQGSLLVRGRAGDVEITAQITPAAAAELGLQPGMRVVFAAKAQEVALHAR